MTLLRKDSIDKNLNTLVPIKLHYRSVDSTPERYAVGRTERVPLAFLATFIVLSALTITSGRFMSSVGLVGSHLNLVLWSAQSPVRDTFPLRLFVVIFFVTYGLFAYGHWLTRLSLILSTLVRFFLACVAIDSLSIVVSHTVGVVIPAFAQQVASLLVAIGLFPLSVLGLARLPMSDSVVRGRRTPVGGFTVLGLVLVVSVSTAIVIDYQFLSQIKEARSWALIGGIGPGVFLVQQIFEIIVAMLGWARLRRGVKKSEFSAPLAVLIPAHNEAHGIDETLTAIDRAAACYPEAVHVYVVDNASSDLTALVAEATLRSCANLTGEVLSCEKPGKAIALNYGLAHVREAFVVRIDADTTIEPSCLQTAMRHFHDSSIGAVGGIPLPVHSRSWIGKVRLVEVLLRHGFFQIGQSGFDGIVGVPGMFTIYRRDAVEEVGGFVVGMNGEDTDVCFRIHLVGYRTVSDPYARYRSEVPENYSHLREQRVRWFRSVYHIAAHNRLSLLRKTSLTGSIVVPFMLLNAARRAMLLPLLLFCCLTFAIYRDTFSDVSWQPVAAVVVGMPLLMAVFVCIVWRRLDALLFLPYYLIFRLLRSYFTLSAVLTLVYPNRPRAELARGLSPHATATSMLARPVASHDSGW